MASPVHTNTVRTVSSSAAVESTRGRLIAQSLADQQRAQLRLYAVAVVVSITLVGASQAGPLYLFSPVLSAALPPLCALGLLAMAWARGFAGAAAHPGLTVTAAVFAALTMVSLILTAPTTLRAAVDAVDSCVPLLSLLALMGMGRDLTAVALKWAIRLLVGLLSVQTMLLVVGVIAQFGKLNKDALIGSVGGSNYLAAFLVPSVLMLLFAPWGRRRIDILLAVLGIVALASTGSLGGTLAFLIAVVIGLVRVGRGKVTFLALLGLASVGTLVGVLYTLNNPLVRDLASIAANKVDFLGSGNTTRLLAGRDVLWFQAWQNFAESPWWGSSRPIALSSDTESFRAHNWLLELLSTRGIFATVVFAALLLGTLALLWRAGRRNAWARDAALACVGAVVHGLVEPNFGGLKFDLLFWLIVATALSMGLRSGPTPPTFKRSIERNLQR